MPKDLNTRSDQKSILALSRAVAPIRSEIERKNIPTESPDNDIKLSVPMNTKAMERRRSEAIRNGNKTNVCAHPPEPTKAKITIYDATKSIIGDRFIFHAKIARQRTLTRSHALITRTSFILLEAIPASENNAVIPIIPIISR